MYLIKHMLTILIFPIMYTINMLHYYSNRINSNEKNHILTKKNSYNNKVRVCLKLTYELFFFKLAYFLFSLTYHIYFANTPGNT